MSAPILVVLGPTATGKSALGMELARRLGGEIVNADALQVYRGLDLGTAKPPVEDQAEIPHHLIDILDPSERFSAGAFARLARAAAAEIEERGAVPIVVGGSGLYLRALLEGISPIPQGDEAHKVRLRERLECEGLAVLRAELAAVDPATADRLAAGDSQRILRALEVYQVSGRPLSAWINERPFGKERLPAVRIGLTLPRTILYDRIADRVTHMIDRGWVDEIASLLERGVGPEVPAFQAIGYRQLVRYLTGHYSLEDATSEIVRATRRFAKRQMTWFRKERDIRWISPPTTAGAIDSLMHGFKSAGGRFAL